MTTTSMTVLDTSRSSVDLFIVENQLQIREELAYLLSTSHFTGSKRYPAFLKWIVERTLAGQTSDLKERTIGVELFGKSPDYDTSNDTIVRFTAGEVRKRLFLAYHQSKRSPLIQIGLPTGSYVPEFIRSESEMAPKESRPAVRSPLEPMALTSQPAQVQEKAGCDIGSCRNSYSGNYHCRRAQPYGQK